MEYNMDEDDNTFGTISDVDIDICDDGKIKTLKCQIDNYLILYVNEIP